MLHDKSQGHTKSDWSVNFELTVGSRVLEDVGVDTMHVTVEEKQSRVLCTQLHHLVSQLLVVCSSDFVEIAQTAMAIILGSRATIVLGEQGRCATQRRQIYHKNVTSSKFNDALWK